MNRTALTTIAPNIFCKRLLVEGYFDIDITVEVLREYFRHFTQSLGPHAAPLTKSTPSTSSGTFFDSRAMRRRSSG